MDFDLFKLLVLALLFFYFVFKFNKRSLKVKERYEEEAKTRLNPYVENIEDFSEYRLILCSVISGEWNIVDLDNIRSAIIADCTKISGQGVSVYSSARFSVKRDENKQLIYFFIGSNYHKFSM